MSIAGSIRGYLHDWLTSPGGQFLRLRKFIRTFGQLVVHCHQEMRHDRAGEMAAALTYRTIFSLVPMVVLALLIFRAFGGFSEAGVKVETWIYNYMGLSALTYSAGTDVVVVVPVDPAPDSALGTNPATQPDEPVVSAETARELSLSIQDKLGEITGHVNFASIGVVGLILFIWAALALAVSVEHSFNLIYNSPQGRAWHLKITIYWAIITLGPVLLMVSLFMAGKFNEVVGQLASAPVVRPEGIGQRTGMLAYVAFIAGWVLGIVSYFTALLASWLLLFLLYVLMPTTRVNLRAAAFGSFVAAFLWEAGKWGFKLYVSYAVPYSKIYGTMGLVPLFLFWIYLTWLIVLFGLELTYTLQFMKTRRLKYLTTRQQTPSIDPAWMVPLLAAIGRSFQAGKPMGTAEMATALQLPARVVAELSARLEEAGLILRVERGDESEPAYTLAMPPEKIALRRVLELSHHMARSSIPAAGNLKQQPGWIYLDRLHQSQLDAAGDGTLAAVLA